MTVFLSPGKRRNSDKCVVLRNADKNRDTELRLLTYYTIHKLVSFAGSKLYCSQKRANRKQAIKIVLNNHQPNTRSIGRNSVRNYVSKLDIPRHCLWNNWGPVDVVCKASTSFVAKILTQDGARSRRNVYCFIY